MDYYFDLEKALDRYHTLLDIHEDVLRLAYIDKSDVSEDGMEQFIYDTHDKLETISKELDVVTKRISELRKQEEEQSE